jgi:hypothetical protein
MIRADDYGGVGGGEVKMVVIMAVMVVMMMMRIGDTARSANMAQWSTFVKSVID